MYFFHCSKTYFWHLHFVIREEHKSNYTPLSGLLRVCCAAYSQVPMRLRFLFYEVNQICSSVKHCYSTNVIYNAGHVQCAREVSRPIAGLDFFVRRKEQWTCSCRINYSAWLVVLRAGVDKLHKVGGKTPKKTRPTFGAGKQCEILEFILMVDAEFVDIRKVTFR